MHPGINVSQRFRDLAKKSFIYNLVDFNFPILKSDGICNLQPEVEHIGFRLETGLEIGEGGGRHDHDHGS